MNLEGWFDFVEVSPWFWIVATGFSLSVVAFVLLWAAAKMAGRGNDGR